MGNFQVRTDLALEARENINEAEGELRGVGVEDPSSVVVLGFFRRFKNKVHS